VDWHGGSKFFYNSCYTGILYNKCVCTKGTAAFYKFKYCRNFSVENQSVQGDIYPYTSDMTIGDSIFQFSYTEIFRVSTPGRRVYSSVKDLPRVYNGLGISIISTPSGVMSDNDARKANVGGEILCQVF